MKNTWPKLNFEEATALLPSDFFPIDRTFFHKHKLRANTPMGIIAYSASREYPNNIWWTSVYPPEIDKNIAYWVIGLDVRGILIIPAGVITEFCNKNNVPKLASGKWSIHIKMEYNNIFLYYADKRCDVSRYYIANELSENTHLNDLEPSNTQLM